MLAKLLGKRELHTAAAAAAATPSDLKVFCCFGHLGRAPLQQLFYSTSAACVVQAVHVALLTYLMQCTGTEQCLSCGHVPKTSFPLQAEWAAAHGLLASGSNMQDKNPLSGGL